MPEVLVTGATGLIGRHIVAQLLAGGGRVRILTRDPRRVPEQWRRAVDVVVGDLVDAAAVRQATENVQIVYHAAGELRNETQFIETNVRGTAHVLEACRGRLLRAFVHYSSVGVMGPGHGTVDESAPCRPTTSYERTKLEGEVLARERGAAWGIPVIVLRPTNVFGEGQINGMLNWLRAIRRGWFRRIGRRGYANYIYAGDVAAAAIALAEQPSATGELFIASDPVSMDEFLDMMGEALGVGVSTRRIPYPVAITAAAAADVVAHLSGRSLPLTMTRVRALASPCLYSPDRLRRRGIRPAIGLQEGLRRLVAWYRSEGHLL